MTLRFIEDTLFIHILDHCLFKTLFFPQEVELHVTMTKSEKGSLGFTVTKGNDNIGCYIHDVVQDPAKSDGRLRPGDRLIKVRWVEFHSETQLKIKGSVW